ncbi:MAG: hypothetical protein GF350_05815 [Chitinivibrionales bacterium]|nr:hypothetical protein [Chitinivibrionales bacterium]
MPQKNSVSESRIRTIVSVCSKCAICCSEPVVPVTESDVRRIMKHTGMEARRIVRLYSYSEACYDQDSDLWVQFSYGRRLLGLKKKQGHCIFLSPANRCTIYDFRPLTCRTFPFQESDSNTGPPIKLIRDVVKCRLKVPDAKLQPGLKKQMALEDHEDDLYERKVRKWNRQKEPGGFSEFLRLLKLAK